MRLRGEYQRESISSGQGTSLLRATNPVLIKQAKKEAVTDATKRALKTFGNVLGNCLYDKEYAKEVVKMKVPPVSYLSAFILFSSHLPLSPMSYPQLSFPRLHTLRSSIIT